MNDQNQYLSTRFPLPSSMVIPMLQTRQPILWQDIKDKIFETNTVPGVNVCESANISLCLYMFSVLKLL